MSFKCFIALAVDQAFKNELGRLINTFRQNDIFDDNNIRWVASNEMHLTLKFLGKVEDRDVPEICNAVTKACQSLTAFEYTIGGINTFPDSSAARVIVATIEEGHTSLAILADEIDQAMNHIGFMLENRQFSGHVTLARIKERKTGYMINEHLNEIPHYEPVVQVASEVKLLQSERGKNGMTYTTMHHIDLRPNSG
jgi:2'-5' RNA ligase